MDDVDIVRIYERKNKTITGYDPEEMTPAVIREHASLNTHHYGFIVTDDHPDGIYIDLSTMMQEQRVGQSLSWEYFIQYLTPAMIESYELSGAGLDPDGTADFHQASVVHPFTTVGLNLSYCDLRDPTEVNKFHKRWDLPDLIIEKKPQFLEELKDLNLANCIVSINGIICNASFFEDKLYVKEGSKNLWCINRYTTPSMTMMDTTPLGELVRLPLSKCKIEVSGTGSEIADNDIKIVLPEEYNFDTYTPLLSICGKMIFPDKLTLPNERTIVVKPYLIHLNYHLLQLNYAQANFIPNTAIVYPDQTVATYLATLGQDDRSLSYDVIYLIKNSNISIAREYLSKDLYWLTKRHYNRMGLLVRLQDSAWMDYTCIPYSDYNLYHGVVYPQELMRITVDDGNVINPQYGIDEIRCHHLLDNFRWIKESAYEMIYLTC